MAHFEANGIGATKPGLGAPLTTDGKKFTGEFGAAATKLDREYYREGHTLAQRLMTTRSCPSEAYNFPD